MIGRRDLVVVAGGVMLAMGLRSVRAAERALTAPSDSLPAPPSRPAASPSAQATPSLGDLPYVPLEQIPNHRQMMRDIIIPLSQYGKKRDPHFLVLMRGAPELLIKEHREWAWETGRDPDGAALDRYQPVGSVIRPILLAIDGMVADGLYCGAADYDTPSAGPGVELLRQATAELVHQGRRALSIEYCRARKDVAAARKQAGAAHVLAYVDQDGNKHLGRIPPGYPFGVNAGGVADLAAAHNWLPLFHSERFGSRDEWVRQLAATNYDVLVLNPFWRGAAPLTAEQVNHLKSKATGGRRLVLSTLPLGHASDALYYWKSDWVVGKPAWLAAPDPNDPSLTIVEYWADEWKAIVGKMMQGIVDLGFNGILLDGADSYRWFEQRMPLE